MFLTRIEINSSRVAMNWMNNPYRVHQRLMMGCDQDPRVLFRVEENENGLLILVQSHNAPNWQAAFNGFQVLAGNPQIKSFDANSISAGLYHFRLIANPTIKKNGKRLGLIKEKDQVQWIERKMQDAGARIVQCQLINKGFIYCHKTVSSAKEQQTYLSVQYDGVLDVIEPPSMIKALENGVGAAKGYGFGLISLARLH